MLCFALVGNSQVFKECQLHIEIIGVRVVVLHLRDTAVEPLVVAHVVIDRINFVIHYVIFDGTYVALEASVLCSFTRIHFSKQEQHFFRLETRWRCQSTMGNRYANIVII